MLEVEGKDVRVCTMEDDVGRQRALVRCTTMVRCRTMQDETNVEQRCVALQFCGAVIVPRRGGMSCDLWWWFSRFAPRRTDESVGAITAGVDS